MPTGHPPYPSWAAGEISPRLMGRIDVNFFHIGARMMLNMRPLPQGPAERRGGCRFVAFPGDEANAVRLLRFVFAAEDADQVYVAAVSDAGIEILRDGGTTLAGGLADGWGKVAAADTDAAITNGAFTAGITGWTDQSTGTGALSHDATNGRLNLDGASASIAIAEQAPTTTATGTEHVLKFTLYGSRYDEVDVRIGASSGGTDYLDVTLRCSPNGAPHAMQFTPAASPFYIQFRNAAAKTVQVDDVSLVDAAAVTIAAPWAAAERAGIKHTQSNDVLYLCHRAHWPRVLERRGHASWSLPEFAAEDGPYLPENVDSANLMAVSAATVGYGRTLTASGGHAPFQASDVGRLFTSNVSSTWGWGVIVGYTSPTVVTIDIKRAFGGTGTSSAWRLGLWREPAASGAGLDGGYPTAVRFGAGERLVFAGSPGRLDGTKVGEFVIFTPGTNDDDPLSNTIADNQTNAIRWLANADDLLLGTGAAEFRIRAASSAAGFTPGNVSPKTQTRRGSADVQAVEVDDAVVFLQRHGRKLIEVRFSLDAAGDGAYRGVDLTRRAEHITKPGGGITQMAYQAEPYGMIWCVRGDGMLPSLTYLRDEQVIAWARHACGRPASGLASVEAVCAVPGAGRDLLFAVVARTIDGTARRSIELLEEPLPDDAHPADGFYVDMGLTLDNTVAATLTPDAGAATEGAEDVPFTAGSSVFVAGDVGRLIHYRHQVALAADAPDAGGAVSARWQWATAVAEITGYTSGTEVTATIRSAFPADVAGSAIASGDWRLTVTSVTGLDHVEGETVAVCGDGAVQPSQVVASGAITLDSPAATVHVGLAYPSILIPVRYEAGAQDGTAQGRKQQPKALMARLHRTGEGFRFGALRKRAGAFDTVAPPVRQVTDAMDMPPGLFSGDIYAALPAPIQRDPLVAFIQAQPLPATVTMLVPKVEVNE